jgi:pyridoxine 5-phosphate synthase
MTKLSVNINKLATLRNARGKNNPNLIEWAEKIESYGAQGITVHPRPDERHIRRSDAFALKRTVKTEYNIEGYPSSDFLDLIEEIKPDQCTLVPDPPEALTSNAGWDVKKSKEILAEAMRRLKPTGVRVSVFMEPKTTSIEDLRELKLMGVHRIEIYTEDFANEPDNEKVLESYRMLADRAVAEGLELNAGHDLNQQNLKKLISKIPEIKEVSIGHALVCEALEDGMKKTIESYLNILR